MISITKVDPSTAFTSIPLRSQFAYTDVNERVERILADVRENKDEALIRYNLQFDHVSTPQLEVRPEALKEAFLRIDPQLKRVLEEAADHIRAYHKNQLRQGFMMEDADGIVLGQIIRPIEKVGIYVPGGTAAYPSTVLMNAIPAKLAGVKELILVTPPKGPKNSNDGSDDDPSFVPVADPILAAAYVAGVDRIFTVGGAQAIAALAYGTQTIPKVDKIVGPGNIYVAIAKKMVYGQVAIDMVAGPSEVMIVADESANPRWVAADLLSQAEHDPMAMAILATNSMELAEKTREELYLQLEQLPRKEIAGASLEAYGRILVTDTIEEAIQLANEVAPEHLELALDDPFHWLDHVHHAGSVFLGHYTTEPLGDYLAGPNHTLPTSGTARFASPLSVDDFIKKTQVSYYSKEALEKTYRDVALFARSEGLEAHARAGEVRFQ